MIEQIVVDCTTIADMKEKIKSHISEGWKIQAQCLDPTERASFVVFYRQKEEEPVKVPKEATDANRRFNKKS